MGDQKNIFATIAAICILCFCTTHIAMAEEEAQPPQITETQKQDAADKKDEWSLEAWLKEKIEEEAKQKNRQAFTPYSFGQEVGRWAGEQHAIYFSQPSHIISNDILELFRARSVHDIQTMIDGYWDTYESSFNQIKWKRELDELQQNYKLRMNHGCVDPVGGTMISGDQLFSIQIEPGTIYERIYYDIAVTEVDHSLLKGYGHALSRGYQICLQHKLPLTSGEVTLRFKGKVLPNQTLAVIRDQSVQLFAAQTDEEGFFIQIPLKDVNPIDIYFMIERGIHNGYTDVDQSFAKEEIVYLSSANILKGTGDGYFHPQKQITRLEFITILGRIQQWPETYAHQLPFYDKDSIHYSQGYVAYAVENGWIKGYEDGSFQPNRSISYQEMEWIMERLVNRPVSMISIARMWQSEKLYMSDALDSLNLPVKRDEMASVIFNLRNGTLP